VFLLHTQCDHCHKNHRPVTDAVPFAASNSFRASISTGFTKWHGGNVNERGIEFRRGKNRHRDRALSGEVHCGADVDLDLNRLDEWRGTWIDDEAVDETVLIAGTSVGEATRSAMASGTTP
jgi:hypothetical protein